MFTYAEALKMQVENERYKIENETLKSKNKQLEKDIDDLQELIDLSEDESKELAEASSENNVTKTLTVLGEQIVPLFDAFFEDKDKDRDIRNKELNLMAQQLLVQTEQFKNPAINPTSNPNTAPPADQQSTQAVNYEDYTEEQLAEMPSETVNALRNEWLARYAASDPEGYTTYIAENY